jgi:dCTP deaminase
MGEGSGLPGLLPAKEDAIQDMGPSNVIVARGTGVLPYQRLVAMVNTGAIKSKVDVESDQIQPASLDLRLGRYAHRVRASFLPGPDAKVMDKVQELDGVPPIDLEGGAVLERGGVYVIELMEAVRLDSDTFGVANPKSSTGRLDVLTRLITDRGTAFDRIDKSYEGQLFLEVAPLTFNIIVHPRTRLTQVRFQRDRGATGGLLKQIDTEKLYLQGQLVAPYLAPARLRDGVLVPVTVDLEGGGAEAIVGYKAKGHTTSAIDVSRIGYYNPREFWNKIERTNGYLTLDKDDFYILATREDVGVPPQTAERWCHTTAVLGSSGFTMRGFSTLGLGGKMGRLVAARLFWRSAHTECLSLWNTGRLSDGYATPRSRAGIPRGSMEEAASSRITKARGSHWPNSSRNGRCRLGVSHSIPSLKNSQPYQRHFPKADQFTPVVLMDAKHPASKVGPYIPWRVPGGLSRPVSTANLRKQVYIW